jgi:hypothetical protein
MYFPCLIRGSGGSYSLVHIGCADEGGASLAMPPLVGNGVPPKARAHEQISDMKKG